MIEPQDLPFPLLLTDCSAPGVRAGILGEHGWMAYQRLEGETGATLFEAVKTILSQTKLSLKQLQSFVYCDGPGSTLGIRINSMAIRTWNSLEPKAKPIFAYHSLDAASLLIKQTEAPDGDFSILSDLRKHSWNGLHVEKNQKNSTIEVVSIDDLGSWPRPRFFIQQRIHSPGLPPDSAKIDYDIEAVTTHPSFLNSLRKVEQPEVFQTTKTEFKKWTPSRHR